MKHPNAGWTSRDEEPIFRKDPAVMPILPEKGLFQKFFIPPQKKTRHCFIQKNVLLKLRIFVQNTPI